MKSLCLAFLTLSMCVLLTRAASLSETLMQETHRGDVQAEGQQTQMSTLTEAPPAETNPWALLRSKRQSPLALCRYCCKCCKNKGCGYCCRF